MTFEEEFEACCFGDEKKILINNRRIIIYGVCSTAYVFLDKFGEYTEVIGYVDNGLKGKTIDGYIVKPSDELTDIKKNDELIVITATFSSKAMARDLYNMGYKPCVDFVVYDPQGGWHIDKTTRKLIQLNENTWDRNVNIGSKDTVLVSFWKWSDATNIMYAYVSNFLAKKYCAKIHAYVRAGYGKETIARPVKEVYESFGVSEIVFEEYGDGIDKEAELLCDEIWKDIKTIDDWHSISVRGVSIGTAFVQIYLRYHNRIESVYDETDWKPFIKKCIKTCLFWDDYLESKSVKSVVTIDYGNYDSILRDYACSKGIPVYNIHYGHANRLCMGFNQSDNGICAWYKYYKVFWEELTEKEQEEGIAWAKKELEKRLSGETAYGVKESPFGCQGNDTVLDINNKMKVLICPHIFNEETMHSGYQLFGNYLSWLEHLAELSKHTDYDWYIKMHPAEGVRGRLFFDGYCKRYPWIKKLPDGVSPKQLKSEGIDFAFTVCGSIGHEYPLIGINVINAGNNPHIAFDFNINPKTKKEFDETVFSLKNLKKTIDIDEIYKFYCIHFLYYNEIGHDCTSYFFEHNIETGDDRNWGSWQYQIYLDEFSKERHYHIMENVERLISNADSFDPSVFRKKRKDTVDFVLGS